VLARDLLGSEEQAPPAPLGFFAQLTRKFGLT
jgi:hypothetical protein